MREKQRGGGSKNWITSAVSSTLCYLLGHTVHLHKLKSVKFQQCLCIGFPMSLITLAELPMFRSASKQWQISINYLCLDR